MIFIISAFRTSQVTTCVTMTLLTAFRNSLTTTVASGARHASLIPIPGRHRFSQSISRISLPRMRPIRRVRRGSPNVHPATATATATATAAATAAATATATAFANVYSDQSNRTVSTVLQEARQRAARQERSHLTTWNCLTPADKEKVSNILALSAQYRTSVGSSNPQTFPCANRHEPDPFRTVLR
jgi:hypothetical protein